MEVRRAMFLRAREDDVESKTQNNRTNGKVIILLKFRHLSALFP